MWSKIRSLKGNLHHAIHFEALCGANLVRNTLELKGDETLVLHRATPPESRYLVFVDSSAFGDIRLWVSPIRDIFSPRETSPIFTANQPKVLLKVWMQFCGPPMSSKCRKP